MTAKPSIEIQRQLMLESILKDYKIFNPQKDDKKVLPKNSGNYVILLKKETPFPIQKGKDLPIMRDVEFNDEAYWLIYTGVGSELQKRIGNHFFQDNAGRSTLRLSLGSLMGYIKIYRDKKKSDKKKSNKKFKKKDELTLTEWMKKNLLVLYKINPDYEQDETVMISILNPPLNIEKNENEENAEFRSELKHLRSKDIQFEPIVEQN